MASEMPVKLVKYNPKKIKPKVDLAYKEEDWDIAQEPTSFYYNGKKTTFARRPFWEEIPWAVFSKYSDLPLDIKLRIIEYAFWNNAVRSDARKIIQIYSTEVEDFSSNRQSTHEITYVKDLAMRFDWKLRLVDRTWYQFFWKTHRRLYFDYLIPSWENSKGSKLVINPSIDMVLYDFGCNVSRLTGNIRTSFPSLWIGFEELRHLVVPLDHTPFETLDEFSPDPFSSVTKPWNIVSRLPHLKTLQVIIGSYLSQGPEDFTTQYRLLDIDSSFSNMTYVKKTNQGPVTSKANFKAVCLRMVTTAAKIRQSFHNDSVENQRLKSFQFQVVTRGWLQKPVTPPPSRWVMHLVPRVPVYYGVSYYTTVLREWKESDSDSFLMRIDLIGCCVAANGDGELVDAGLDSLPDIQNLFNEED